MISSWFGYIFRCPHSRMGFQGTQRFFKMKELKWNCKTKRGSITVPISTSIFSMARPVSHNQVSGNRIFTNAYTTNLYCITHQTMLFVVWNFELSHCVFVWAIGSYIICFSETHANTFSEITDCLVHKKYYFFFLQSVLLLNQIQSSPCAPPLNIWQLAHANMGVTFVQDFSWL